LVGYAKRVDELMRHYLDIRAGNELASDEEGTELQCIERAQQEAAETLADMGMPP
jgi:hypothetical protein